VRRGVKGGGGEFGEGETYTGQGRLKAATQKHWSQEEGRHWGGTRVGNDKKNRGRGTENVKLEEGVVTEKMEKREEKTDIVRYDVGKSMTEGKTKKPRATGLIRMGVLGQRKEKDG